MHAPAPTVARILVVLSPARHSGYAGIRKKNSASADSGIAVAEEGQRWPDALRWASHCQDGNESIAPHLEGRIEMRSFFAGLLAASAVAWAGGCQEQPTATDGQIVAPGGEPALPPSSVPADESRAADSATPPEAFPASRFSEADQSSSETTFPQFDSETDDGLPSFQEESPPNFPADTETEFSPPAEP